MRSGLPAVGAVVLAIAGAAAQQQIQLFMTFVTDTGAPVDAIDAGAIRIMENGIDGQILNIEPLDRPLNVQLLIDNGVGLGRDNLIHLRDGVRGLFDALPDGTEAALITTSPQPRYLVRPTVNRQALRRGADLLAPDAGTGHFVDALNEAAQRIERDGRATLPVIIALSMAIGDDNVRDAEAERLMERLGRAPVTVHVVVLTQSIRSDTSGANQIQIGRAVTKLTNGRYEGITAPSRLATLLPELGADAAAAHARKKRQFRITVERPNGASGPLGKISMGSRGGIRAASVSLDGR